MCFTKKRIAASSSRYLLQQRAIRNTNYFQLSYKIQLLGKGTIRYNEAETAPGSDTTGMGSSMHKHRSIHQGRIDHFAHSCNGERVAGTRESESFEHWSKIGEGPDFLLFWKEINRDGGGG